MKVLLIISLLIVALQSCNESGHIDKAGLNVKADTGRKTLHGVENTGTVSLKASGINDSVLGLWALAGEKNASFEIQKSNIFYPDQNKLYQYKIIDDIIKIKYEDYKGSFAIKMRGKDTLVLKGDDEQVYFRFK